MWTTLAKPHIPISRASHNIRMIHRPLTTSITTRTPITLSIAALFTMRGIRPVPSTKHPTRIMALRKPSIQFSVNMRHTTRLTC